MSQALPSVSLTELEARLASPEGPALRELYRVQLAALAVAARAHLRQGLAPDQYHACTALAEAADAAQTILAEYPCLESLPAPADFTVPSITGKMQDPLPSQS